MSAISSAARYIFFDYDLLRLFLPSGDPEAQHWLAARRQNWAPSSWRLSGLLGPSAWLLLLLCMARAMFVWACRYAARVAAKGEPGDPGHTLRWAEGWWTLIGGTALLAWSWTSVFKSNGGCPHWLPLDTAPCVAGWPLLRVEETVRFYYCAELAWYLHLLAKHHLGVGTHDSSLMRLHHLTTIYLILTSYCSSLHRVGVLIMALMNSSTPLLHLSKMAHHAGHKRAAVTSFAAFAAAFAASRVVLFPLIILPFGFVQPLRHIPRVLVHYPLTYTMLNVLLLVLVVMQWVWFGAIIRIMRQAASGDSLRLNEAAKGLEQAQPRVAAARWPLQWRRAHSVEGGGCTSGLVLPDCRDESAATSARSYASGNSSSSSGGISGSTPLTRSRSGSPRRLDGREGCDAEGVSAPRGLQGEDPMTCGEFRVARADGDVRQRLVFDGGS